MPKKKPFSQQLREIIAESGVSQYRISKDTGIGESTLYRFLDGENWIGEEYLNVLADYLGLRVERTQRGKRR